MFTINITVTVKCNAVTSKCVIKVFLLFYVCFACRLKGSKSRGHGYVGNDLLTSLDVKSATHQTVGFE